MAVGSLGDELKRAGLISDKKLAQIKHEERQKKKRDGREGQEQAKQAKRDAFQESQSEDRKRDQQIEDTRKKRKETKEEKSRIKKLIRDSRVRGAGNRRWYFETRSGAIPFLMVNDGLARKLQSGELAIVEVSGEKVETFGLVPADVAREVAAFDAKAIRFQADGRSR